MKFFRTFRIAALIACVALPGAAFSQQNDADFNPATVNSFAGAVLAGRTAESDRDFDTAIALYKKALRFEPDNDIIKQHLMVLLFKDGRFDEGVVIADRLKGDSSINAIAQLALGINALRQHEFSNARAKFEFDAGSDVDRLMFSLLKAWAIDGEGKQKEALELIDAQEGPDWYPIFKNFHKAAMEEIGGNQQEARQLYTSLVVNQDAAKLTPETYMRAAIALAIMEANAGNKRAALDAIASASAFASGYAPLNTLQERVEADNPPPPDITSVEQGAAAVLYTIGSALYRGGEDDIVSLYLNFANVIDPGNAETLVLLGDLEASSGNPEKAIEIFRSIPDDSIMHRVAELQLGLNLADLGRHDEAKAYLKKLIEDDPEDIRSYLAYGSVLSETKEYREMAENYDQAAKVIGALPSRSDWNVFYQRGIAYERLKEWDKAEPIF
jgi:tetratricopeptide (TPR) repeat protein